ncbi:hypothetical protein [uncultured Rhodoferax sp.]|uniref:hypothetical protein n=1 Tax=uncultured Rhodoferax sp. TaxID=223188 RepID=UPI0025F6967D|nr:hypothetical protein [uncultured Rhodoferax sp.]
MDKNKVLSHCPTGAAWQKLKAPERQRVATVMIEFVLGQIEQEGREPDAWESGELLLALGAVLSGFYALACTCVAKSLTPVKDRGEHDQAVSVTLEALKNALAQAMSATPSDVAIHTEPNLGI